MSALARLKEHPRGFWFVFWGELAERASFYGMRTVLALYLVDVLRYSRSNAGTIVNLFVAGCYLLPILGGFIADRFLGRYKTILYFSFPYILGHLLLGEFQNRPAMFAGLALLALGSGTIKPSTTPLMGMIYEKADKDHLLTEAFSYFYAAINIGAFVTSFALPSIRDKYGYQVALLFPTIAMVIALGIFAAGKRYYPTEQINRQLRKSAEQRQREWETLLSVAGIFSLIVVWRFVYDQNASSWIFFTRDHMELRLWPSVTLWPSIKLWHSLQLSPSLGWLPAVRFPEVWLPGRLPAFSTSPDQLQSLNPILIVLLTPVFNWLWGAIQKRTGREVSAMRKMTAGFLLTVFCLLIMTVAGYWAMATKVSVWLEIVAYVALTLGELCIAVVGLEFAYKVAAPGTKSTVTAAWLLTAFVGNSIGGIFDQLYDRMPAGLFFGVQAVLMGATTVAFYFVGRRFDRRPAREPLAAAA